MRLLFQWKKLPVPKWFVQEPSIYFDDDDQFPQLTNPYCSLWALSGNCDIPVQSCEEATGCAVGTKYHCADSALISCGEITDPTSCQASVPFL
jgi:hypothetical protein